MMARAGMWLKKAGNSIKVENTGNTDVNVTYDYKAVENGITGSFTDGENPVSAPVALPENGSSTVYLILGRQTGKRTDGSHHRQRDRNDWR